MRLSLATSLACSVLAACTYVTNTTIGPWPSDAGEESSVATSDAGDADSESDPISLDAGWEASAEAASGFVVCPVGQQTNPVVFVCGRGWAQYVDAQAPLQFIDAGAGPFHIDLLDNNESPIGTCSSMYSNFTTCPDDDAGHLTCGVHFDNGYNPPWDSGVHFPSYGLCKEWPWNG